MKTDYKVLFKKYPWFFLILAALVWLRIFIWFGGISVFEAETLLSGKIIFNGLNLKLLPSNEQPLPAILFGAADSVGGYLFARITAVILGVFTLLFFYKFSAKLIEDNISAFLSTVMFASFAPLIFLGRLATYQIGGICFLAASLYYGISLIKEEKPSFAKKILTSLFFVLAILFDSYLTVFGTVFFIYAIASKDRNKLLLPAFMVTVVVLTVNLLIPGFFANHFTLVGGGNPNIMKLIFSVIQYLIVPLTLFAAIFLDRSKYFLSTKTYTILFLLSLVTIAAVLIKNESQTSFRLITYSAVFLFPPVGLMLKDYILRHTNTRTAAIFVLVAGLSLSFYQTYLLENSGPDYRKAVKLLEENTTINSNVLAENASVYKYYLFPKLRLNQFLEINTKEDGGFTKQELKKIIEGVVNGKIDIIALDGTKNAELSQRIRDDVTFKFYRTLYSHEYKISTVLYKEPDGELDIFKSK